MRCVSDEHEDRTPPLASAHRCQLFLKCERVESMATVGTCMKCGWSRYMCGWGWGRSSSRRRHMKKAQVEVDGGRVGFMKHGYEAQPGPRGNPACLIVSFYCSARMARTLKHPWAWLPGNARIGSFSRARPERCTCAVAAARAQPCSRSRAASQSANSY